MKLELNDKEQEILTNLVKDWVYHTDKANTGTYYTMVMDNPDRETVELFVDLLQKLISEEEFNEFMKDREYWRRSRLL